MPFLWSPTDQGMHWPTWAPSSSVWLTDIGQWVGGRQGTDPVLKYVPSPSLRTRSEVAKSLTSSLCEISSCDSPCLFFSPSCIISYKPILWSKFDQTKGRLHLGLLVWTWTLETFFHFFIWHNDISTWGQIAPKLGHQSVKLWTHIANLN